MEVDAFEVEIEVRTGYGDHGKVMVVGLPDDAVRESKDRVRSAITHSACGGRAEKITMNLALATVRKEWPMDETSSRFLVFTVILVCK